MATRKLDKNFDWTFGKGRADYLHSSSEIAQNVVTRLRSFKFDWFLDTEANIAWLTILGMKKNQETVINEINRVLTETEGIKNILEVSIINIDKRKADIQIKYIDIYDNQVLEELEIL